jgi:rSAM/selenodomain-associated transferase 2
MISVIIPTYNEERALPQTLPALFAQPGDYEVIVVDGGSTDRTSEIAAAHPGVQWLTAPKGRASQMNAGACIASGEWLLFLHADTLLPPGALLRLSRMEKQADCLAGGFRHRFSTHDWRLRLISWLDNLRCRRTRIIFGDQAMFVRRCLFQCLGGFPERPILEDVQFCQRLVRVTKPLLLREQVITDARKFLARGVWRSLAQVVAILACVELGRPIPYLEFFDDVR